PPEPRGRGGGEPAGRPHGGHDWTPAGLAARFARGGMTYRGLGSRRLRQALRVRGVPGEAAAAGLRQALEEISEASALDGVARRYWRTRRSEEPRRRVRRVYGLLLRGGFPGGAGWGGPRGAWA